MANPIFLLYRSAVFQYFFVGQIINYEFNKFVTGLKMSKGGY